MTGARLDALVVGYGHVAEHAYLPALARCPACRVVGVVEPDPDRRARAAAAGLAGYATVEDAAAAAEAGRTVAIDLTPAPLHGEVNARLLAAGFHCLSEKPGAGTAAEWRRLTCQARDAGLALVAAPQLHRGWSMATVLGLLASGRLGSATAAHIDASKVGPAVDGRLEAHRDWFYGRSVGAAMDIGPYALTTAVALFGRPSGWTWRRMAAEAVRDQAGLRDGATAIAAAALHETFVLTMEWPEGPVATAHVAFGRHRLGMPSCTVYCTGGRIELDLWAPDGSVRVVETPGYWEEHECELVPEGPPRNLYDMNLEFCLQCVDDPRLLPAHWEQVAAVLEMLDGRDGGARA